MVASYVISALVLVAVGVTLGTVAVISIGIRHEEKASTLTGDSPSRAASGARAACGVSSRAPGVAYRVRRQSEDDPPGADRPDWRT